MSSSEGDDALIDVNASKREVGFGSAVTNKIDDALTGDEDEDASDDSIGLQEAGNFSEEELPLDEAANESDDVDLSDVGEELGELLDDDSETADDDSETFGDDSTSESELTEAGTEVSHMRRGDSGDKQSSMTQLMKHLHREKGKSTMKTATSKIDGKFAETTAAAGNGEGPSKEGLYKCFFCVAEYSSKKELFFHIKSHKNKNGYTCNTCQTTVRDSAMFKEHIRSHIGAKRKDYKLCIKLFQTDKTSQNKSKPRHKRTYKYPCEYCQKMFPSRFWLTCHVRKHTGEKPCVCKECGKCFAHPTTLQNHLRTHTGEKPYVCSECSKSFALSGTLKRHMLIHTDEKPFTCEVCSATFKQSSHLKSHMLKHTGEKPFPCTKCNKSFSGVSNLKRHMVLHTGERPYTCDACGKSFADRSTLRRHILVHKSRGEKAETSTKAN